MRSPLYTLSLATDDRPGWGVPNIGARSEWSDARFFAGRCADAVLAGTDASALADSDSARRVAHFLAERAIGGLFLRIEGCSTGGSSSARVIFRARRHPWWRFDRRVHIDLAVTEFVLSDDRTWTDITTVDM